MPFWFTVEIFKKRGILFHYKWQVSMTSNASGSNQFRPKYSFHYPHIQDVLLLVVMLKASKLHEELSAKETDMTFTPIIYTAAPIKIEEIVSFAIDL